MTTVRNESGATAIEYAIVASLIALVIISAATLVGTDLTNVFNSVASSL